MKSKNEMNGFYSTGSVVWYCFITLLGVHVGDYIYDNIDGPTLFASITADMIWTPLMYVILKLTEKF